MQQFQCDAAGLTAAAAGQRFCADVLSWRETAHWLIDQLHTDGKRCPHCKVEIVDEARLERWYQVERIKCAHPDCRRFFTSLTNTPLHGSTLDPRELFLLAALVDLGVPPKKIVQIIPLNPETVKRWARRLNAELPSV